MYSPGAPMTLPTSATVVVIGAGAIGSFAALELARSGQDVVILDRKVPGIEASGTNAGSLGIQNKPVRLAALSMMSVEHWRAFDQETGLDAEYHRTGGFRVAETDDGVQRLRQHAEAQRSQGVPMEHISGDEARAAAPYIGPTVLAANYCPLDGHNNALTATSLVCTAAQRAGARLYNGVEVVGIHRIDNGGYRVDTSAGTISCERLILAAGVWARDFLVRAGIEIPVVLRNNQMMVTEPAPPILEHVIFHVDGHLTLKQVYPATSCLVGGGWPGTGDFRTHQNETQLASTVGNAAVAVRIVPSLGRLRVIRSWSRFDWRTSDEMPFIGEVPGHPGAFVCTSCFGGYTLSPALGQGLAIAAMTGELPQHLQEFSTVRTMPEPVEH